VLHFHVRVRRWVVWWFYAGVVCGIAALANIFGRDLTPTAVRILLLVGISHWLLGGLVCWAADGIQIQPPPQQTKPPAPTESRPAHEWHAASDLVLPGSRKRLMTRK
jgi:hypothetical protein